MCRRWLTISSVSLMVLFVSLIGSIGTGQGQTWTVCLAGPPTCQFRGIQEALAAASDGDTILVRAGSYRENLVITKSRITLRGDDPRAVRLEAAEPLHAIEIDLSAVGVTIEGFTVRGAGQGQTGNFSGIFVAGAGAILQRNIFQDNNVGIWVTNPVKEPVVQILESTFTSNGKDIIVSSQALIQGNRFDDEVEVSIGGYAEFRKNQGAILLINGAALVEENRFTQVKVFSFAVPGLPTILRRNQIIGTGQNIEEGSPEEGLIIRVSSPLTVEDNLITQHNFSAIVIDRSGAKVLLQRNTITNSGYGLYLIAGFPQFVLRVEGNTIERNQWGGVILLSEDEEARFEIVDNLIRLNQGNGIVVGMGGKYLLQSNRILDNDYWGVVAFIPPCVQHDFEMRPQVTGSDNKIEGNGKQLPPEAKALGDGEGNVCPKELTSLKK